LSALEHLLVALAQVSAVEWAAVVLALVYLLLAIRQNAWCWVCSIASALLYLFVFGRTGLYMQAALQVFYVATAIYGWRAWRGTTTQPGLPVRRWPLRRHVIAVLSVIVLSGVNGMLVAKSSGVALVPYADAAIAWGSVLTTLLVARKVLENWLYWIVLDFVAAGLYWTQGLYATSLLFLLYCVLAWRGYHEWVRDLDTRMPHDLAGKAGEA
jgi:nicotinamide mononucleotide transporter